MQLSEIHKILTVPDRSRWNVIELGTTYRVHSFAALEYATDPNRRTHDRETLEHAGTAAWKQDVRLTMSWGMSPVSNGFDPGPQPWSENFPDNNVSPELWDVFWCGALVDRYLFGHVDGAHGCGLPWPALKYIGLEADPTTGENKSKYDPPRISEFQHDFGRLAAVLEGYGVGAYDGCIERSGMQVEKDLDGGFVTW